MARRGMFLFVLALLVLDVASPVVSALPSPFAPLAEHPVVAWSFIDGIGGLFTDTASFVCKGVELVVNKCERSAPVVSTAASLAFCAATATVPVADFFITPICFGGIAVNAAIGIGAAAIHGDCHFDSSFYDNCLTAGNDWCKDATVRAASGTYDGLSDTTKCGLEVGFNGIPLVGTIEKVGAKAIVKDVAADSGKGVLSAAKDFGAGTWKALTGGSTAAAKSAVERGAATAAETAAKRGAVKSAELAAGLKATSADIKYANKLALDAGREAPYATRFESAAAKSMKPVRGAVGLVAKDGKVARSFRFGGTTVRDYIEGSSNKVAVPAVVTAGDAGRSFPGGGATGNTPVCPPGTTAAVAALECRGQVAPPSPPSPAPPSPGPSPQCQPPLCGAAGSNRVQVTILSPPDGTQVPANTTFGFAFRVTSSSGTSRWYVHVQGLGDQTGQETTSPATENVPIDTHGWLPGHYILDVSADDGSNNIAATAVVHVDVPAATGQVPDVYPGTGAGCAKTDLNHNGQNDCLDQAQSTLDNRASVKAQGNVAPVLIGALVILGIFGFIGYKMWAG